MTDVLDPPRTDGTDDTGGSPGGVTLRRVVALVATFAFFGGAVGYFIGMRDTGLPGDSSVDIGFLRDMADHHAQAVEIAFIAQARAGDPFVRQFAAEVLQAQGYELGIMDTWLSEWGHERGTTDRTVMAWMGEPTPYDQMPGLQPGDAVEALRDADPGTADRLFLELMYSHHEGGLHMAEYAAGHARLNGVRELAAGMVRNQVAEMGEYRTRMGRLGIPVPALGAQHTTDAGHAGEGHVDSP